MKYFYSQILACIVLILALPPMVVSAQRGSYAHVAAGSSHGMVIKKDGTLWAFGNNKWGQLGDGTIAERHIPVKVLSNVKSVACGRWHTMAILNDCSLYAWGNNGGGQLGDGTDTDRLTPVKVFSNVKLVASSFFIPWRYSMTVLFTHGGRMGRDNLEMARQPSGSRLLKCSIMSKQWHVEPVIQWPYSMTVHYMLGGGMEMVNLEITRQPTVLDL